MRNPEIFQLIKSSIARREGHPKNPCRLFDGAGDGLSGLHIDRFDSVIVGHIAGDATSAEMLGEQLRSNAQELTRLSGASSFYLWTHNRGSRQGESKAELLSGDPTEELVVTESGIRFLIRPVRNMNAGLFLDTAELRELIRDRSTAERVLNLFAYTGSLGLAAALGGASEVVQVDISKSILGWCRENFDLNRERCPGLMRFIAEDIETFLKREIRRQERGGDPYGIIIIDPPSFGVAGRKSFQLARDFRRLLSLSLTLVRPGGILFAICNAKGASLDWMRGEIEHAATDCGVRISKLVPLFPPKTDFTAEPVENGSMRGFQVVISAN